MPVGVYGLPRGGTNFICAWLHYHPELFCVSERCSDWCKPLRSYWRYCSLFRHDGIQDKRPSQIQRIIFNKVQRFPELCGADVECPSDTRFIFYLRNPIRIHMSREAFRSKHETDRKSWADSRDNFRELLADVEGVLDIYRKLSKHYQCLLLSHEYFCWHHGNAIKELFRFFEVEDSVVTPRSFFKRCGRCGAGYVENKVDNIDMLVCPTCEKPLEGFGRFNPLREIKLNNICSAKWKERNDIEDLMADVTDFIGADIAQYYINGDYSENFV